MDARLYLKFSLISFGLFNLQALAFENSKVLPEGIRNILIKNVQTEISEKSSSTGDAEPMAKPLLKDLTLHKVLNGQKGMKKNLLEAFLRENDVDLNESMGVFTADMKAQVSVVAPLISYGVSEKVTFAFVLSIYQARSWVQVGFKENTLAQDLVNRLDEPEYNQTESARELGGKINGAVGELNKKLVDNGFRPLTNWEGNGIGDLTMAAKYRFLDHLIFKAASSGGVSFPTGSIADPDILNSVPFGKGCFTAFTQIGFDQFLMDTLFLNEYVKYSYFLPAQKTMRQATEDESIEVTKERTKYQLGQQFDAGISLQYEDPIGVVGGIGYLAMKKLKDRYEIADPAVRSKAETNTDSTATYAEAKVGYSSIPAFQRRSFPVPMIASLEYKKHLTSKNTYMNDFVSVDLSVFF